MSRVVPVRFRVRNVTKPQSTKAVGWCDPCKTQYVWCNKNGKRGGKDRPGSPRIVCPSCGAYLLHAKHAPEDAPTYSLDGVMFDNGKNLEMFTPWGGYV